MDHHLRDDAKIAVCMDKPYMHQESVTNSIVSVTQMGCIVPFPQVQCMSSEVLGTLSTHTHLLHCFKIVQLVKYKIYIQNSLPSRPTAEIDSHK